MQWIIDRMEGKIAVVESQKGTIFSVPVSALPKNAKEGDVLSVSVDEQTTEDRRTSIKDKMKKLFGE